MTSEPILELSGVVKHYGAVTALDGVDLRIERGRYVGLLGPNGAGKSTLFRLLAGSEYPNSGRVITDKSISWPVALSTGIHPQMTGRENTRFIGRINGVADLLAYEQRVMAFAELGNKFDLPVATYSSGMKPRLAFACSIAIDFDIYLIDEVTSVGDATFKRKARQELMLRSEQSNVIMISHSMSEICEFCDSAIVIDQGELTFYNDLDEGITCYQAL